MKTLLSSIAIVSMMLLSLDAPAGVALANGLRINGIPLNGIPLNGLYLNGTLNGLRLNDVDSTVNLHSLAQAPLVKAD